MSSVSAMTHELRVIELQLLETAAQRARLLARAKKLQVELLRALEEARYVQRLVEPGNDLEETVIYPSKGPEGQ